MITLDLLDTRVVLDLPESFARRVERLFPPETVVDGSAQVDIAAISGPGGIQLVGGGPTITVADEATALAQLLSRINQSVLAAAPYLGIHAGVVAVGDRAIAFPAASGIGKSTLVTACLQRGMSYVSDEALCLNWTSGDIIPYPRPIGLSVESCRLLGLTPDHPLETAWSAATLGAAIAREPLQLEHLILLDDSVAELEQAPRNAGAAELLRRSFNHWHHPERAFELAHEIVRTAQVWRIGRHDPHDSAKQIADLTRF